MAAELLPCCCGSTIGHYRMWPSPGIPGRKTVVVVVVPLLAWGLLFNYSDIAIPVWPVEPVQLMARTKTLTEMLSEPSGAPLRHAVPLPSSPQTMIELLRKRRSIRKYTGQPVSRQARDLLVETLLRSPTSRNGKSWEFVVVDDADLLESLSRAKQNGAAFLKEAALGIVIAGDSTKSDVWVEDTAIAAALVQATAEWLGLGTCWIQIRNRPHDAQGTAEGYIQQLLGLPEHIKVASIISVGHPAEAKPARPTSELEYHKVKHNHYSTVL
jgi:nitroreductase